MIACAIAFNAKQECSRFSRVLHSQVDEKTCNAHLRHHIVALLFKDSAHGALKIVCGLIQAVIRLLQNAGAGEDQILL